MDNMLQALAAVPERSHLELGITLNVKGLLITGYIISQESYFNRVVEGLKKINTDQEVRDTLLDFFVQLRDKLLSERPKDKKIFPDFIHLRDVKIYPSEGRGMPTYGDALWRGQIRDIDGFSLGEMVPTKFDSLPRLT